MIGKKQEWSNGVKLLSLSLAGMLWVSVLLERPGEMKLQVPVQPEYLPAGLCMVNGQAQVEVTVTGPWILLSRLPFRQVSCAVDLSGAAAGTATFTPQESWFRLSPELKVVRIAPSAVTLTLAREAARPAPPP